MRAIAPCRCYELLKGSRRRPAGAADARPAADVAQAGGSRLDVDLDGKIDHPGAAIMDPAWPKIANAFMAPQLGPQLNELDTLFRRYDLPPGGQYSGWHQYFDRDIRGAARRADRAAVQEQLLRRRRPERIAATAVWAATRKPGRELDDRAGRAPERWRSDAVARADQASRRACCRHDALHEPPGGIQQVISFDEPPAVAHS